MIFVATAHYGDQKGLPAYIFSILTEQFNEKKPMEPLINGDWARYNRHQHGTIMPQSMRLPQELIMVCKGLKSLNADFFAREPDQWVISARFLDFWSEHALFKDQYESAPLKLLDTKGKSITKQAYYLVRFTRVNDELIDFERSPSIPSTNKPLTKTSPKRLFYSELAFRQPQSLPPALIVDNIYFWNTFLCQDFIKEAMETAGFLGLEYYTLFDFAQESRVREAAYSIEEYHHYKQQVLAGNHSGSFSKEGLVSPRRLA